MGTVTGRNGGKPAVLLESRLTGGTSPALSDMAVRFLPRGAKVADAAFPNANFPAALVEAGIEAFCGYLSIPTGNLKNWSPQRFAWFVDFPGVGHGMFCEQFETIVLQGYSAANLQLGRQCQDMADSFGVPDDVPMWFAVDTSPFGHFSEIAASFQAYRDTNRRPLGCYGGSQLIEFLMDEGLVEYGHVPSALSWSATNDSLNGTTVFAYNNGKNRWYLSPRAHMLQHNSVDFAGSRIDPSDVLRDTPFWFPSETKQDPVIPPVVIAQESDVVIITNAEPYPDGGGGNIAAGGIFWALMPDGTKRHIDQWAEIVARTSDGAVVRPQTTGNIQSLPGYVPPTSVQGAAGPPGPQGPAPHGTFNAVVTL